MKKALTICFIFCFLASASFATMTRTLTMGDANNIVHDVDNIWLYPSALYDYPELAIGEIGEWYDYYDEYYDVNLTDIGLHYKFGEKKPFVMGLYFTLRQPATWFPYYLTDFQYYPLPNNRIDFFYSRKLGDNKFGFHMNYVQSSYKYESMDTVRDKENTSGYAFDLGLTAMEDKLDIAAGVGFLSWTDQGANEHDRTKPDGNMMMYARGRYFYEADQKVTVVPHAGLMYAKLGNKVYDNWDQATDYDQETDKNKDKWMTIDLGCGMNYTPAAGILAIGDIGIMFENEKETYEYLTGTDTWYTNTYKDKWFTLPYFKIGLDAVVFDWMNLRMGGTSYWETAKAENEYETSTTPNTEKTTWGYVSNDTYLGAGFHWGNLKIDTYICPQLILEGFNFISGENNSMNYQVSVQYQMF
jgi:hypothetical protein